MGISESNYEKVVEAMKVLEKYPKEKQMYENIKTEEFLQRISENNFREEGRKEEKKEAAKKLLSIGMETEQIEKVTKLTEEEIEEIKKQID